MFKAAMLRGKHCTVSRASRTAGATTAHVPLSRLAQVAFIQYSERIAKV